MEQHLEYFGQIPSGCTNKADFHFNQIECKHISAVIITRTSHQNCAVDWHMAQLFTALASFVFMYRKCHTAQLCNTSAILTPLKPIHYIKCSSLCCLRKTWECAKYLQLCVVWSKTAVEGTKISIYENVTFLVVQFCVIK